MRFDSPQFPDHAPLDKDMNRVLRGETRLNRANRANQLVSFQNSAVNFGFEFLTNLLTDFHENWHS